MHGAAFFCFVVWAGPPIIMVGRRWTWSSRPTFLMADPPRIHDWSSHRGTTASSCRGHGLPANQYFRRPCPDYMTGNKATTVSSASPQSHEIVVAYFWGAITTPCPLLGDTSRRRAHGCNSSYIEELAGQSNSGHFQGEAILKIFRAGAGQGSHFSRRRGGACIPDILCKSSNHSALVGQNGKEQSFAGNGIVTDNTISIIKQNFDW